MTDIENSTALLERLGDRYAAVRDDVQGIIRRALVASGGREVDARADEFFAAFERAASAIEAAVAIQLEARRASVARRDRVPGPGPVSTAGARR